MGEQHFTTDDGCKIFWRQDGDRSAPALLLSNSLGTDSRLWQSQMDIFAQHFNVIRYDTRGHGQSDAPTGGYSLDRLGRDVVQLLDHLQIERCHFAGISLGGMTGQWLGFRATERLNRIVLANTSAYMGPPSGWADRINSVLANGMDAMVEPVLARWFTPNFLNENPSATETVRAQLISTNAIGYAGCSAAIRDMDLRPTAPLIAIPTLVIAGSHDPATPLEHGEFLARTIRKAKLKLLDAAHLSNVEQPDEFNAAVLQFLGEEK